MKKAMRKMIPAVIMLLISAMLVGTSTYAWFSMNKTVTVTGMTVKAKGTDNVMISDAAPVSNKVAESSFDYGLNQTRVGNLQPASTVNGEDFFYTKTSNVSAIGAAKTLDYETYDEDETTGVTFTNTGKAAYDDEFNNNYGITSPDASNVVYGYIDYSFYIKATNAKSSSQNLIMSRCNLLYNNAAINSAPENAAKAWRVALFAASTTSDGTDVTAVDDDTAAVALNCKSILTLSGASYFDSTAVATESTKGSVSKLATSSANKATIASVAAGNTVYYKVVVRLWLEGEDTTCTSSTFARLNGDWSLDLAFAIDEGDGVYNIASAATTTITGSGNSRTAALSVGDEEADTFAWFVAGGTTPATSVTDGTHDDSAAKAEFYPAATGDYYCVITTTKGSKYRTADVHITVE